MENVREGLEGVVVASTRLSDVDGENGVLVLGGHRVEELSGKVSFEEACGLLWDGGLPHLERAEELRRQLGEARVRAFERLRLFDAEDGMDALRASVAALPSSATREEVVAAVGVFAAAWIRRSSGHAPVAPDAALSHASDYLRMVRDERAGTHEVAALDAYLVAVSDHGMNASTFTARVVASTGSDAVSAVVAAIGALKGPLHGGAPGPVLDMLDAIGAPDRARAWLDAELAAGRRIMGMGHRIYRVRDPRAAVLERALAALEQSGVTTGRLALARAVERAAEGALRRKYPDRPLA